MGAFSVATGVTLLYDEGLLPPNPQRQAVAFASPADSVKWGGEGLAMKQTATDLAMEDNSENGTVELSSAALQFLVQNLVASEPAPEAPTSETVGQQANYPYSGGSESSDVGAPHGNSSRTRTEETTSAETPFTQAAPAATSAGTPGVAAAPINVLA
jgi:hypothetical protein